LLIHSTHFSVPAAVIQNVTTSRLCSVGSISALENFPGTARDYLAIDPNFAVVATSRDPCIYEFQGTTRQSTDNAISVASHSGSISVTPEQYITTANIIDPDIIIAMSDEVPSDAKRTRASAAVDRTLAWLPRCLDALKNGTRIPSSSSPAVFACVQGGQYLDFRDRCTQGIVESSSMPSVTGICVGGLGTGETPEQRAEIIQVALKNVPTGNVRMISSVGTPEEVLLAVSQGIDLFDVSFVLDATTGGYALNFPIDLLSEDKKDLISFDYESAANSGSDDTKINLWAVAFKNDSQPLVPGCSCLACTSHTRAYIHHLLESHEMTAQVLLEAHNTTHYLKFYKAVQRAVEQGKLQKYIEKFMERKQQWIMAIDQ
jgi:queuine tRNA-ribosyltransferase accessory subunit